MYSFNLECGGTEHELVSTNGTEFKNCLEKIYADRHIIDSVKISKDGQRVCGRLVFKDINLRPSPMAKVAFESQDYTLGVIMNLAGSVMMYPDMEVRELNDNLYVRIDDSIWAIVGEQTVFYAENMGDTEYRL